MRIVTSIYKDGKSTDYNLLFRRTAHLGTLSLKADVFRRTLLKEIS